jgi:hypothetical protein
LPVMVTAPRRFPMGLLPHMRRAQIAESGSARVR